MVNLKGGLQENCSFGGEFEFESRWFCLGLVSSCCFGFVLFLFFAGLKGGMACLCELDAAALPKRDCLFGA